LARGDFDLGVAGGCDRLGRCRSGRSRGLLGLVAAGEPEADAGNAGGARGVEEFTPSVVERRIGLFGVVGHVCTSLLFINPLMIPLGARACMSDIPYKSG